MKIPRVLIIAGSDSGGGAGIQADLKTVSALGAFGMTAITALTAQNTTGVYGVLEIEPKFVVKQIEACVSDIGCDAVKTGMLVSTAIIDAVAAAISDHKLGLLVVDPVMIAKSGAPLLKPAAIAVLKAKLLPLAADVLYDGREFTEFRAERIDTKNTHGTGCIFASAIAANLAHKKTVRESVTAAKDFITAAIRTSLAIGKGYGPANPMALLYQEPGVTR